MASQAWILWGMRRTLWIDALCINQDDLVERSAQVSIMGSIYSNTSKVLIWLGEESANSQAAFEAMKDFVRGMGRNDHKLTSWKEKWRSFEYLCQRPYWGRLWIIQEVCLASSLRVHCGSDAMGWDDFLQFWKEGLTWYSAHLERRNRNWPSFFHNI